MPRGPGDIEGSSSFMHFSVNCLHPYFLEVKLVICKGPCHSLDPFVCSHPVVRDSITFARQVGRGQDVQRPYLP